VKPDIYYPFAKLTRFFLVTCEAHFQTVSTDIDKRFPFQIALSYDNVAQINTLPVDTTLPTFQFDQLTLTFNHKNITFSALHSDNSVEKVEITKSGGCIVSFQKVDPESGQQGRADLRIRYGEKLILEGYGILEDQDWEDLKVI
jgi:hypothetical protein